jgi:phosphoglycolate phosphatase
MAKLLLRGIELGQVEAVLFDKDGTLSISEPQLITLAKARVFLCLEQVDPALRPQLQDLLERAYGLRNDGKALCPAGITAVAHRDHNLISTATALAQTGLGWPDALAISELVFAKADQSDGRREGRHTSSTTEGLLPLLQQLQGQGVRCAVISNDDVAGIEHFLASHQLSGYFSGLWSAEHQPRKPNPQAVLGLCSVMGVAVEHCALVGDANSDLRMAVAAGIPHQRALGYTAAWSSAPPLNEPHPLIHHWDELSVEPAF